MELEGCLSIEAKEGGLPKSFIYNKPILRSRVCDTVSHGDARQIAQL